MILVLGTESESVRSIGVGTSTAGPGGRNCIVMKLLSSAPKKGVIAIEINKGPYHSSKEFEKINRSKSSFVSSPKV